MASDASASSESMSGLTPAEAQDFHKLFTTGFAVFAAIATVAHLLVWIWRPWIPGNGALSQVSDAATVLAPLATFM